jgi:hypothetical protein
VTITRPPAARSYVVVEGALSQVEVARLNAEIDRAAALEGGLKEYPRRLSGESEGGGRTALAGDTALDPESRPEGKHRLDFGGMLAWDQPHCEPFRELLCHGAVKPYLEYDSQLIQSARCLWVCSDGFLTIAAGCSATDTGLTTVRVLSRWIPGRRAAHCITGKHTTSHVHPRKLREILAVPAVTNRRL